MVGGELCHVLIEVDKLVNTQIRNTMSIQRKNEKRYSLSFKQMVVRQLEEEGLSVTELQRRYGIKGSETIQRWIRKFGKTHLLNQVIRIETMDEKDKLKELQDQIKQLKIALADSLLAQRSLEVVIEEANKEYHTDLKKNFGDKPSSNSGKSSA